MSKYYEDILIESMRLHSADDRPKKRRLTESDGAKNRFKEIQVGPDAAIVDRINADKNVRKLGLNNDHQFIKSVHKEVQRLQKDHPSISFDDAVEMAIDSAVGEIGIGGGPGILDNWHPKGKPLSELTPEERAKWEKDMEEIKRSDDYKQGRVDDRVDLGGAPLAEARNPENDEVNAAIRKWANSDRNRLSKKDQETLGKYGISLEDEDSALKQHVPKEVKKYYSGKRMVGSNPQIRTGLTKNAVKSKHDDFDSANYLNKERKTDSETHRKNIFKNAENHAKKKNESLSLKEGISGSNLWGELFDEAYEHIYDAILDTLNSIDWLDDDEIDIDDTFVSELSHQLASELCDTVDGMFGEIITR